MYSAVFSLLPFFQILSFSFKSQDICTVISSAWNTPCTTPFPTHANFDFLNVFYPLEHSSSLSFKPCLLTLSCKAFFDKCAYILISSAIKHF